MDVIQLSGYTEDEKLGIARKYLVPKQLEAHGLTDEQLTLPDDALRVVIREYTREAGVRNLERRIARPLPQDGTRDRRGQGAKVPRRRATVRSWLGPRRFLAEPRKRTADPGVATGLAYTRCRRRRALHRGDGLPGQGPADDHRPARRGDAGVRAGRALVGARARGAAGPRPDDWFAEHDVHIHVPAGAVPKDGPSAGITMATAIASLVRGMPVAEDVGDDRRDHAHRPGAADRRPQGEGARRTARRARAHRAPPRERARPRGAARPRRATRSSSSSSTRSRRCSRSCSSGAAARVRRRLRQPSARRRCRPESRRERA